MRHPSISAIKAALAHPSPDVVAAFVRETAELYLALGSQAAVAKHYGCHRSVLTEALAQHAALRAAFDAVATDGRAVAKRAQRAHRGEYIKAAL